MLTKRQLAKLRSEITLNSLYLSDYKNSFGIDPHTVCDFFDGFIEYISDDYTGADRDFWKFLKKSDTIENLWTYYNFLFDCDPLPLPEEGNDD